MWDFRKRKVMDVPRVKSFHRSILWRSISHHSRPIELNDSSFTEALLTRELSVRKWCKPRLGKVPKGSVPVYVGSQETRFIIPMVYLSMPGFRKLMEDTADEFGFGQEGGLKIACEEDEFEEAMLKCLADNKIKTKTWRK